MDWLLVVVDGVDCVVFDVFVVCICVVVIIVGLYVCYGLFFVEVCVVAGMYYVDFIGEVFFVCDCVDVCDEVVKCIGVCIVNVCGMSL